MEKDKSGFPLHIFIFILGSISHVQLTLEQHEFALCGSTYTGIFSITVYYSITLSWDWLNLRIQKLRYGAQIQNHRVL